MSSMLKILGGIAVSVALSSAPYAQSLVSEKNIPLAMAQTIANAAMEKCKEMGFKVSVAVVDRAGLQIVMLRGDGAGLHTPEGADRKAYTARSFRAPSADFVKRMQNDPASVGSKEYTRVLARIDETGIKSNVSIKLTQFGLDIEPELTAKLAKRRARIYEVPISYSGRDYSEGKKIGWKDGFRALWCIARFRFFD